MAVVVTGDDTFPDESYASTESVYLVPQIKPVSVADPAGPPETFTPTPLTNTPWPVALGPDTEYPVTPGLIDGDQLSVSDVFVNAVTVRSVGGFGGVAATATDGRYTPATQSAANSRIEACRRDRPILLSPPSMRSLSTTNQFTGATQPNVTRPASEQSR